VILTCTCTHVCRSLFASVRACMCMCMCVRASLPAHACVCACERERESTLACMHALGPICARPQSSASEMFFSHCLLQACMPPAARIPIYHPCQPYPHPHSLRHTSHVPSFPHLGLLQQRLQPLHFLRKPCAVAPCSDLCPACFSARRFKAPGQPLDLTVPHLGSRLHLCVQMHAHTLAGRSLRACAWSVHPCLACVGTRAYACTSVGRGVRSWVDRCRWTGRAKNVLRAHASRGAHVMEHKDVRACASVPMRMCGCALRLT